MKSLKHRILLASSSCILLCSTPALSKEKNWFVDTNLVYQQGSDLSKEYLAQNAPAFSDQINKKLQPWIVRILVQHSFSDGGHLNNHGTGTILEGGKVITAKHVLTEKVTQPSEIKVFLTTTDGRVFNASVIRKGETDWAVLQMETSEVTANLQNSPIKLASPIAGETAVFLGYPAQLGLDNEGRVKSFQPIDSKNKLPASQLFPMPVIGSVDKGDTLSLSPLAGFPAVGGMSGGPIFNLKGDVIAVQKSIATTKNDATGEVIAYNFKGESSDLLDLSAE